MASGSEMCVNEEIVLRGGNGGVDNDSDDDSNISDGGCGDCRCGGGVDGSVMKVLIVV